MHIKRYITDRRIYPLIMIVVALALLDLYYGLHLGIEFAGGTQIPITLVHGVNATEMQQLISIIDQRVSTFGLKQVTVEGIGNSEIYVIVPTVSEAEINKTISIIESQGAFMGIVNGREAINGSNILSGSIGAAPPQSINNTVSWAVSFYITQSAAQNFARVVFGQANQPLYMFLDRPSDAVVLINESVLGNTTLGLTPGDALSTMQKVLAFGNQTIQVISVTNTNTSINSVRAFLSANRAKYKTVLASYNLNASLLAFIKQENYTLKLESNSNMTPSYFKISINTTVIDSWPMVGLLSAPLLNPSVTNGSIANSYQISGIAPASLPKAAMLAYAQNQSKTIASVLSGGALPLSVIVGTPTKTSPTLGKGFLDISVYGLVLAVVFVSIFIIVIYRRLFLITPILLTTIMELFIIISVIGLIGTIDVAAVAGMIAVVGTGVDAQIIITDEVLVKRELQTSTRTLLGHAFYIIWADAALLTIAMLPLLFSTSLVDITGFAEATIIGALMGAFLTRPAYGAIIARHYGE